MVKEIRDVSWEAEEYISKEHHTGWFIGFALVCLALSALAVLLKWWPFLVLVLLSGVVILINIFSPARKLSYSLDKKGLHEGNRFYAYSDFRAFGILQEGGHYSAILIPRKRFGLQVKVYFPEQNGEAIVDALGARLPMEEVKPDFLDKIVNFLRI